MPFIGQALHLDDAIFWDFARNNLSHPFQQHIPNYFLMGRQFGAFRDTHPAFDELYISLFMLAGGVGAPEALFHLGFIIFPLIAGASMFFLGSRFTRGALPAALLLLSTPAVMVLSHTLMGDLPMTAFWLAATAAYIYGTDRRSPPLLALASILTTLTVFTGYQGLALILLLPAYAWIQTGRLRREAVLPAVLPVVAFAAFTWFNLAHYGALPRFSHAQGLSVQGYSLVSRFQGMILQLSGASVFPPFLAGAFMLRRRRYLALPAVAAGAALLGWRQLSPAYPPASAILFAIFIFTGACLLIGVFSEGLAQAISRIRGRPPDRDFLFLALWLVSILAAVVVLLPDATTRYYLPVFAPMVLLMFREAEAAISSRRLLTGLALAAIGMSFVAGLWLSAADYRLAQAYKDFALSVNSRYHPTGTVWFVGEWGFRHYMEQEGYRYLPADSAEPKKGDLIIEPGLMQRPVAPSLLKRVRLADAPAADWSMPVRVMSPPADAGFYGTYWGRLPFSITSRPLERFKVYTVSS